MTVPFESGQQRPPLLRSFSWSFPGILTHVYCLSACLCLPGGQLVWSYNLPYAVAMSTIGGEDNILLAGTQQGKRQRRTGSGIDKA